MKILIPAIVLVAAIAVAAVFYLRPSPSDSADAANAPAATETTVQPFPVEAVIATHRTLTRTIVATGRLMAGRRTELSSGVSGRIRDVPVREGDRVNSGDILLQLDEEPFQLKVERAMAKLLNARFEYAQYITDTTAISTPDTVWLSRELDVFSKTQAAFSRGETDETSLKIARRNLEAARLLTGSRRLELIAQNTQLVASEVEHASAVWELEQTAIHAPFSGVIAARLVEEGQQVSAGETCLELIDISMIRVKAAVLESDLGAVGVGHRIRISVTTWPGELFEGRISRVYPTVDAESGTGYVEAELPNPRGRLKPGMYAEVQIDGTSFENRLAVPDDAIVSRDERTLVFRIQGGSAQWTYVTLGQEADDWREVTSGLSEGDTVAVTGNITLAHDVPVRVRLRD